MSWHMHSYHCTKYSDICALYIYVHTIICINTYNYYTPDACDIISPDWLGISFSSAACPTDAALLHCTSAVRDGSSSSFL